MPETMYIAVYVIGGIIDTVETSNDLEKLKAEMIERGNSFFRQDYDDYKIFSSCDFYNPVFRIAT